jgi:hypothetical protein
MLLDPGTRRSASIAPRVGISSTDGRSGNPTSHRASRGAKRSGAGPARDRR